MRFNSFIKRRSPTFRRQRPSGKFFIKMAGGVGLEIEADEIVLDRERLYIRKNGKSVLSISNSLVECIRR